MRPQVRSSLILFIMLLLVAAPLPALACGIACSGRAGARSGEPRAGQTHGMRSSKDAHCGMAMAGEPQTNPAMQQRMSSPHGILPTAAPNRLGAPCAGCAGRPAAVMLSGATRSGLDQLPPVRGALDALPFVQKAADFSRSVRGAALSAPPIPSSNFRV